MRRALGSPVQRQQRLPDYDTPCSAFAVESDPWRRLTLQDNFLMLIAFFRSRAADGADCTFSYSQSFQCPGSFIGSFLYSKAYYNLLTRRIYPIKSVLFFFSICLWPNIGSSFSSAQAHCVGVRLPKSSKGVPRCCCSVSSKECSSSSAVLKIV